MKQFTSLLILNLKALLLSSSGGRAGSKKKGFRAASGIGMLALFSAVGLYVGSVYSIMLGNLLSPVGAVDLMWIVMAILSCLTAFFTTVFNSQGIVFGGKDMDLMFSLPISAFVIMLSKIMAVYLENLVFTFFIMLPATVIYMVFTGFSAVFLAVAVVSCLFLPLLPTLCSLVVSFVISLVSSRTKHKNFFVTLLSFAAMCVVLVFSLQLNQYMSLLVLNPNGFRNWVAQYATPFIWIRNGAIDANWIQLLAFFAVSLLPFLAVVYLFSFSYKYVLTKLVSQKVQYNYKLGRVQSSTPFVALYKKELSRFFNTPMYLLNMGLGAVMAVGGGIAAIIYKNNVFILFDQFPSQMLAFVPALVVAFLAFCISTMAISAVSISLEGKSFWILREAPVPTTTIFWAKLLTNWTISLPSTIIGGLLCWIAFGLAPLDLATILLPSVSFAIFLGLFGFCTNLVFPKLDGINDTIVVKQSMSVLVATLGGMVVVGVLSYLFYLLIAFVSYATLAFSLTAILLLLSTGIGIFLKTKGVRMFENLS